LTAVILLWLFACEVVQESFDIINQTERLIKKKKKKLRDVTSHILAQTAHVALFPPKLSCGVGSRAW